MPYSITTKDGITIQNIPDDVPSDSPELKARVAKIRAGGGPDSPSAPNPTDPSKLKGSVLGGAFMGLRDPIDAGAQLLSRGVDSVVGGINSLTGLNLPRPDVQNVDNIVKTANAEYDKSRVMAGRDGVDVSRIVGNIANPLNRVVPMAGATSTAGVVGRSALQGGISGLLQPVTETDNFAKNKAAQVALGTAAGGAGGYIADKAIGAIGNAYAALRARPGFPQFLGGAAAGTPPQVQAMLELQTAAAKNGVDLSTIPKSILESVRGDVQQALQQGKTVDANALLRIATGKAVLGEDAGLMLGQATRDPQLFARELDLRGIQGAGKPIADRLALQNERLIGSVKKQGAAGAPDAYDAGKIAYSALQKYDAKLSADVTKAYNNFRLSSGATIDVPLQPVAQRVGEVLDTFGRENVPGAVLSKLDSYGLLGTKQTKVFDLLEADKLIKTINANYDPLKGPQAAALGQIRKGLNEAIELADTQTQGATGKSAEFLRDALAKAKSRFSLHEAVPALEAAVKDPARQEAFVQQFITSKTAGIDQVQGLTKILSPEALKAVQQNVLAGILEKAAPGATAGSDVAKFSQAGFRSALDSIGDRKLALLFGNEGVQQLRQIAKVSQWIQAQPAGSAVNNSNTGAAVMNLVQGLAGKSENPMLNKLGSLPGVNLLKNSLSQSLDESAARSAIGANVPPQAAQLAPEEIGLLRRYLPVVGGLLGGTSASSIK